MSASLVGSEMCIRDSPSRASGTDFEAASGPAQFQVRTPEAILACSINVCLLYTSDAADDM
eukprot:2649281-Alexandrium_andersonii.AAC.1